MESTNYTDFDWAEKKHKAAEWSCWEASDMDGQAGG